MHAEGEGLVVTNSDTYTVVWHLSRVDSLSVSDCDSLNMGTSNSRIQYPRVIVWMKNVSPASEDHQISWIPTTFTYGTILFLNNKFFFYDVDERHKNLDDEMLFTYWSCAQIILLNLFREYDSRIRGL